LPGEQPRRRQQVPRYLVKRTFPGGLPFRANDAGADALRRVCDANAEAIRRAAALNSLPVDSVTEVSVLVPHFYR
jgi:hypothetical protein